ncbi:hypothetical protein LCG56_28985 (plasmid) [Pseudomonas cannabina pv. alisalensis]|uniref:Uncharacterized protein n=1 Tax=Pseudomonas syringae pv. maculicola str. ES4326 TaxID=629265 RepID=A0A8T8CA66_PSEYM|nr:MULTISPECIES: hypothetical protein [Pseudomonas syringae group]QHF00429.1 hypothetical protein PMA4326_028330 [Pseudomonas syringae pv. maculicola str. ES4326]UBZ00405.1 hypothetical protein LCG56_28985 [Pseudomonas cannabina pv. alisalensis]
MANEIPQARNNAPQIPERTLRIDGERTAAMYTLAIRVARLDTRLRELAGNPTVEGRKQYRLGNETFARILGVFEDGLMQVEKDVDMNSRRGPRQGKAQPQRRETQARPQVAQQKPPASPVAPSSPAAEAKPAKAPREESQASTAPAGEVPKAQTKQPQKTTPKPAQQNGQKPQGQQSRPQAKNPQKQQADQKADVATVIL